MVWVVKKEKLLREEEEEQRPTLCKFSFKFTTSPQYWTTCPLLAEVKNVRQIPEFQ